MPGLMLLMLPAKKRAETSTAGAAASFGYADIIEATQDVERLNYRPRTAETRRTSSFCLPFMDFWETSHRTLYVQQRTWCWRRSKMKESNIFGQLVSLAKKITDYGDEDVATDMEKKDAEIDDELGVAVVFDDEEQEDVDDGVEIKDEVGEEELVIADNLNAEIVLGIIRNRDEAVQWLGYTYLYVRMLKSPSLYSVGVDYQQDDGGALIQKRADIYERSSGRFQSTELGRIATVFALSNEFKLDKQRDARFSVLLPEVARRSKLASNTPLDLQPLPLSALHNKEFEAIYSNSIQTLNKIQTQVFQALYTTDKNVFIGAPTGSGKTICAEFVLLRPWSKREQPRAVCIEPYQDMVDMKVAEWKVKFSKLQGGKEIVSLTGETSADLRLLEKGDDIVCTPTQWDVISRRWCQQKNVQSIGLLIADEVQLVGGEVGPTYEVIISRTRYVSAQTENKTRIVACGVSLANACDLGEWIGAPSQAIFNFSPGARPLDMDIHIQSFQISRFPSSSLMIAMSKPAYLAIVEYSPTKPVILFLTHCTADEQPDRLLNVDLKSLQLHLDHLSDKGLVETLKHGIAYYHEALSKQDKPIVQRLFESGAIQVLVASKDIAWSLPVTSYMVVIMGVQYFEGKEHRYVDYPVMDVLQMMGRACRPTEDDISRCVLMCQQTRKDFYRKFLAEGLPIVSHLPTHMFHDYFLAEIAADDAESKLLQLAQRQPPTLIRSPF
ncbi:hypothetical protein M378DRAFT_28806 [Amanita muscaria Koide BX008]|uniref:Helicase ATP-binding domain-containing protein n=1 Tax=Amanita muscaria (strain Koide BX008) TaxID=946122 RepID=A0A0C2WC44_AMAMK|nr:hypothetical protein M378DRAFT_28806 [Amanita muscaria Koide BX008]